MNMAYLLQDILLILSLVWRGHCVWHLFQVSTITTLFFHASHFNFISVRLEYMWVITA